MENDQTKNETTQIMPEEEHKTKLDLDLEQYGIKVSKMSASKLFDELEKVESKMVVPFIDPKTYDVVNINIKDDIEQKNRIYMRKVISSATKWIGYAIKKCDCDYADVWKTINATFVSPNVMPNYNSIHLAVDEGQSIMDCLSLEGLKLYKKFLLSIANKVVFENQKFGYAVKQSKYLQMAICDDNFDDVAFDRYILPRTWQTYYKYEMKQKMLKTEIKERKLEKEDTLI